MNEVVNKFLLSNIKVSIFYYINLSNITSLVTKTALTAVKNKTSDHSKYITTPEFSKLTAEHFTARLKQANSATKGMLLIS